MAEPTGVESLRSAQPTSPSCQGVRKQKGLTAAREAAAKLKGVLLLLERRLLVRELDGRDIAFLVHEGHAEVDGKPQLPAVTGKASVGKVQPVPT